MKSTITYRKKTRLLLWGSVAMLLICYMLAFKRTIEERKVLKYNRTVSAEIENSSSIHGQLLNELSSIESGLSNVTTTNRETQEIIIELINTHSLTDKIKLVDMPGLETDEEDGFATSHQTFTVQGDFISLLRFVRSVEETPGAGKISSADFYRYNDKQSGFSATRVKLYLQNVKMKRE